MTPLRASTPARRRRQTPPNSGSSSVMPSLISNPASPADKSATSGDGQLTRRHGGSGARLSCSQRLTRDLFCDAEQRP